jgi:hypothetical protein
VVVTPPPGGIGLYTINGPYFVIAKRGK